MPAAATTNGHGSAGPSPVELSEAAPVPTPVAAPLALSGTLANLPASDALGAVPDEIAYAIDSFLETMEQFLSANEEVMGAYLGAGGPAVLEQPQRPLVGTIVACEPELELLARRVVDPLHDRYLLDHTLGRTVSRTDAGLHALALMPLAMSIEILAEGASCLLPATTVIGMRDLRAHRWLAFQETPLTLEVRVRRLPAGDGCERVRAELFNLDDGHLAGEPVLEATVLLGDAFPQAPAAAEIPTEGARAPRWAPEQLYDEAMFHQPLWQGVRSIELVAPGAASARLEVLPREGLLRDNPRPSFVLDPVVLDAAGQVIGFWAAEMLAEARVVFPFRLAALDVYGPTPPEGESLTCNAAIRLEGDQLVSSNIDVLDAGGRCWMRLRGWEDKRFAVPERFVPLSRPAQLTPLARSWRTPLAPYREQRVACRSMDSRLPTDRGLWKPVWASRVLGRHERELFGGLAVPERRQLEWLGARSAAKECVAELLREALGVEPLPAEIEILPDEQGAPLVVVPGLEGAAELPVVSLSHAHGRVAAFAAIGGPGCRVGIDIEPLIPRPEGFEQVAVTEAERRLLEQLPADAAEEWLLRIWCGREAAGKAAGSGLLGGPDAPRAAAIDARQGLVLIDVAGRRLTAFTHRETSAGGDDPDLVVATVLDPGPPPAQPADKMGAR